MWSGGELSLFKSDEPAAYFSFVRTPVTLVADLKRARPVLRRISPPLFEAGVLPRLAGREPDSARLLLGELNRLQYVAAGAAEPREVSVPQMMGELIASPVPLDQHRVDERLHSPRE